MHPQPAVDDRAVGAVAHPAGADRVIDQHQAPAHVVLEVGVGLAPGPGFSSAMMISRSAGCSAMRRASRTPATIEATSSGSDSEFVRIRGFAVGSAERSHTRPRALGEISTGAIAIA